MQGLQEIIKQAEKKYVSKNATDFMPGDTVPVTLRIWKGQGAASRVFRRRCPKTRKRNGQDLHPSQSIGQRVR